MMNDDVNVIYLLSKCICCLFVSCFVCSLGLDRLLLLVFSLAVVDVLLRQLVFRFGALRHEKERLAVDFSLQVQGKHVVEGHVVSISTKDDQVVPKDDSSMAVTSCWSLSLHVEDLHFIGVTAKHG